MRLPWLPKRKKSASTLSSIFSDSVSPYALRPRKSQQGTLALPTKLDEVADSVHAFVPQQLPGEQASQDDVRYFLYQILTLKDYSIARKSPQWVLETCMLWEGDGSKLRSLPPDAFQQLCPLTPGYATIDWTVKSSKFRRQDIPPCGVRDEIGQRIKDIVEGLKRKEEGHRGPGWQNSSDLQPAAAPPGEMDRTQTPALPLDHRFSMRSLAPAPGYPTGSYFYSLSNHSLPILHQMSPIGVQHDPSYMQHQASFATSQCRPPVTQPVQRVLDPEHGVHLMSCDKTCDRGLQVSSPASPTSSYCQAESISSRFTESTAKTSPPSSESEHHTWPSKIIRPSSVPQPVVDSQYSSPGLYQASAQRTSTATLSRYRFSYPSPPMPSNDRSSHPAHYMAHLRSPSYSSHSTHASSETSLTPSDSATNKYGFRRDSIVPPGSRQHSLQRQPSYHVAATSTLSQSSTPNTFVTALPYPRGPTPSRLGTAAPVVRGQGSLMRPINNYSVDAHAFDTAEHIGRKSMSGPIHSLLPEEGRRRKLARGKSESGLDARIRPYISNSRGCEESVGPLLRFQNPRTGQPRLTIYETIEQHGRLGKQHLENQRRVEMQNGRLTTVYETIEEREFLDGKPQRGVDNTVDREWSRYL